MKNKILSRKTVYKGQFVDIRLDILQINNRKFEKEIIMSECGVFIIAVDNKNRIALIKQYRHNHGYVFEIPSGAVKKNESSLAAAKRELQEEANLKATKWKLLSRHHNGIYYEGINYFYLARNLSKTVCKKDKDELIEKVNFFSFKEINSLIKKNKIPCIKNRAALWLIQLYSKTLL